MQSREKRQELWNLWLCGEGSVMEAVAVMHQGWTPDSSEDLDLFTRHQHCGPPGVAGDPLKWSNTF